ncbi:TBC1 domain family member 14 [Mycena indigotica]|uniref:TBC1 domain family member 14 n=1 Tax=Mycena indigotica TaxID=2126181 RepID=A0A8H6SXE4_9AGAR|nr:TBC1 domain family member 14 [Mycena indigotica]KAF7307043.1 TBC1 domain family member 14 [Mycena indigotica]
MLTSSSTLDLDDAFGDGDEDFTFNADAIRRDMATQEPSWGVEETTEAPSIDPDDSVSTLDINGPSRSVTPPQNHGVDEDDGEGQFSQISLSESTPEEQSEPSPEQANSEPASPPLTPYPSVIIDVSQPPAHRVTLSVSSAAGSVSSNTSSPPQPASAQASNLDLAQSVASSSKSSSPPPQPPNSSPPRTPPPIPMPLSPKKPAHRTIRSAGPSALEKVMSRTRPHYLPPKPRKEDEKHLTEWAGIMKQSRAAAEKRRQALQDRRSAREKRIEDSLPIWEKEIVPNWKAVHKNPTLRKLWWQGIPSKLRASMWENAVGNPLALNKDNYRACLTRSRRAMSSGAFPSATLALIEQDISTTLPALHIFDAQTGPLHQDLKDMLTAWVVSRSDEGLGYTPGAARIAAMLLLNMAPQRGFIVMRNLLERHCLRSFFGGEGAKDDVNAYYRIFDTLLADGMPKIYFNFKQHLITPSSYLPQWLIPLFLDHLPFEACARIWDVLLLEGDSFLYRAALGMLAVLEPRLFFPDRTELLELLRGENKAALDAARRDGVSLNGGKYEIYGVDEETLWERIDSIHDSWKDSTWLRLIQRELPDL